MLLKCVVNRLKNLALFDLDGTLFDTDVVNFEAYKKALEEHSYTLKYEDYTKYCKGRQFNDFIVKIVPNREDLYPIIHRRKKELYPSYLCKARVNIHLINMIKLMKKSYVVAVVTTASRKNVEDILDYFKLNNLFDFIITGDDVKNNKPDPECYLKAIEKCGTEIKNVIIFEDSKPGIEAARKTGSTVFIIDKF